MDLRRGIRDDNERAAARLFDALGLEPGDTAVDLGCGTGWYAFAAARTTGAHGRVVAVDRDAERIRQLRDEAQGRSLRQVHALRADIVRGVPLAGRCADLVMVYDVLQLLHETERSRLYGEIGRVLKAAGVLSVHVRHLSADPLARLLRGRSPDDIRREVAGHGFRFGGEYRGRLWHGGGLVDSVALSFRSI